MSQYLTKVRLRNFRSFGDFQLDLPDRPGALILSGPNGLGKSSFFDAVEWGLTAVVKRLAQHTRRNDTEAVYLTREGAEPFSHAVTLEFGQSSVQRAGNASGPVGTPPQDVRALLVSPDWREDVKDLSVYLALTHFLGQGADQRFMSRESGQQWETLRGPSGVERLEKIWKRLRGRSPTIALNRRVDVAAADLRDAEGRLARWDALIQRLRRLEGLAAAAGALPRAQIVEAAAGLRRRLAEVDRGTAHIEPPAELSADLVQLAELIVEAQRAIETRLGALGGVGALPGQYADTQARMASVAQELQALQDRLRENQTALEAAVARADQLARERRQHEDRAQRLGERISLMLGAQSDLREVTEAEARASSVQTAIDEAKLGLEAARKGLAEVEGELAAWRVARDALAVAEARLVAAELIVSEASPLTELEAALQTALARRQVASDAVQAIDSEFLEAAADDAAKDVEALEADLKERRDRAGLISSAVASLAAHLTDHDLDCPVCRTPFPEGELKRLAELSAKETDERLPQAERSLDEAKQRQGQAQEKLVGAGRAQAGLTAAESEVAHAQDALDALRDLLSAKLEVVDSAADLLAMAQARRASAAGDLERARRAVAAEEPLTVERQQRRTLRREEVQKFESQLQQLQAERGRVEADRAAAEARYQVRLGEEGVDPAALQELTVQAQAERDQVLAALEGARAALVAPTEAAATLRATSVELAGQISGKEQAHADLRLELERFTALWTAQGLAPPPGQGGLQAQVADLKARRSAVEALETERRRLAEALQVTSQQEELENLRRAVAKESEGETVEAHRLTLLTGVDAARASAQHVVTVQNAILGLSERLKDATQSYSEDFLEPLNELIAAFNDALLTDPGTSVALNADYYADRSEFNTRLREKNKSGAPAVDRPVNPRLILSEGQLAANGFSILCSASAYYPWSRWRALLLDDPLQHNDVIHAAAFSDVMRNLVELEGYQVMMSSHDRAETEFLERKFTAARLPCTVVQLISEAPKGVTYEVRNNAPAREALQATQLRAG